VKVACACGTSLGSVEPRDAASSLPSQLPNELVREDATEPLGGRGMGGEGAEVCPPIAGEKLAVRASVGAKEASWGHRRSGQEVPATGSQVGTRGAYKACGRQEEAGASPAVSDAWERFPGAPARERDHGYVGRTYRTREKGGGWPSIAVQVSNGVSKQRGQVRLIADADMADRVVCPVNCGNLSDLTER
jgi:hypothetical protein